MECRLRTSTQILTNVAKGTGGRSPQPDIQEAVMPVHYIYLIIAVAAETIGTTALQASQQFSKLGPTLIVLVAYGFSFYMLGLTLKFMPVGIVYAIWSGLGILLIAVIAYLVFGQRLDLPAVIGMGLIMTGIVVIHLFSKTSGH
jgi:small multidrug resistance pump